MPNYYHLKVRRDTAANWALRNPVPVDGEICVETDTKRKKIGDGTTVYNALPYDQPSNATQSASGLMSAADKQKLDNINLSQYAKLTSPIFTGVPQAPTASGYSTSKQIATLPYVLNSIAQSVISSLSVRICFNVPTATVQAVITDSGIATCMFMAVNGVAVEIEKNQKLASGVNVVDFLFAPNDYSLIEIPGAAFKGITNIESVTIPERVNAVGLEAFLNTTVKKLYALPPTPPTLNSSFTGTPLEAGSGTVYVHKAIATYYQQEWSNFPNITSI